MAKRKKKSSKSGINLSMRAIAVIALAAIITYVWQTIESRNTASAPATHTSASALQRVAEPAGLTSQIIEYPGFTVSFNADHHQPNWVSWELTRDETRNNVVGGRQDNFAPDPRVKGCPTLDDYRRSGYDRGHMAPASDMKWSREAYNACFLLTNMSPQNNALNSGSWKSLEDKCRTWAMRDSALIIICGPVLTDRLRRTIGATGVTVPERYFKVVLAPYANPPRAIGFIMPNSRVAGGMQASAVSVDEVEAITGFDFFADLPDDIENAIEADANFSKWEKK